MNRDVFFTPAYLQSQQDLKKGLKDDNSLVDRQKLYQQILTESQSQLLTRIDDVALIVEQGFLLEGAKNIKGIERIMIGS